MTDKIRTVPTFKRQKTSLANKNFTQTNQKNNLLKPVPRSYLTEKVILCS
ncbi:hypothetical protein BH10BAC3_BH10BAC3_35680 [soil metagenome]